MALARPSETAQLTTSTVLGAIITIGASAQGGFHLSELTDIAGPLTIVVGAVAAAVTWYTARKQRDPRDSLSSAPDGKVTLAP